MEQSGKLGGAEREIVDTLLETKAVNFEAIGSALAKYGPRAAVTLDGDDVFCLTMKIFLRVFRPIPYRNPWPWGGEFEDLAKLRESIGGELSG
jgi:hypothetical protein